MTHRTCSGSLLLVICFAPMLPAADWQQWRGPTRDGTIQNSPPLLDQWPKRGIRPVWLTDSTSLPSLRNGGWSSPVVADGQVLLFTHHKSKLNEKPLGPPQFPYLPPEKRVGMSDGEYAEYERNRRDEQEKRAGSFQFHEHLYCLHSHNGKKNWINHRTSVYTRFAQSGSPAIAEGRILLMGAGRVARAVSLKDGKDLWETRLPGDFRDQYLQSSFLISGKIAVVLAGNLFGLDVNSGEILWQAGETQQGSLHSSPVLWSSPSGPLVIANMPTGETVAVTVEQGLQVWSIPSQGGNATPVVCQDKLLTYGSSRKKGLRCYQLEMVRPKLLWTFQGTADPGSSPVVVGNNVYVQGERRMACVSLETGRPHWSTLLDLNRPRYTSLIAADGKILYGFDGILCFRDSAEKFDVLAKGMIDTEGLLAAESSFRDKLGIDELEKTAEGQREAEALWRKTFSRGPLACTTPAMADGRLYVRLKEGLACYDLRQRGSDRTPRDKQ